MAGYNQLHNKLRVELAGYPHLAYYLTLPQDVTVATLKNKFRRKSGMLSGILDLMPFKNVSTVMMPGEKWILVGYCLFRIDFDVEAFVKFFGLPFYCLDESFNFDYTTVENEGMEYMRGGEVYHPPYGWFRYALNVRDKYGSNAWLGYSDNWADAARGEWPVSYHGTAKENISPIVEMGYKLSRSKRGAHGKGIYTSPQIEVAETYAEEFKYDGKMYKVVIQNRVNPQSVRKARVRGSRAKGKDPDWVWVSEQEDDVRPYGILLKSIEEPSEFSTNFRPFVHKNELVPLNVF